MVGSSYLHSVADRRRKRLTSRNTACWLGAIGFRLLYLYFPGSSEISQKCYCYLLIFHWTSIQRLLQFFFCQRAKWSFVRETIVISRQGRSFRICQGNTPATWRTVVQLLFYSAVERYVLTQVAIIQKWEALLFRNTWSVLYSLCSENSFKPWHCK